MIEYTGAITTTASPSVTKGLFKAGGGEGMVAFNTNNPKGKYVITNSTFRYTGEDAIYVQGGECIFANNLYYAVGNEGGEAINVKAGCKVDAAFNVMYSPNTNAFKLSNSGVGGDRFLAQINAYNNTIINAGWRRDPGKPKGGSVWAEGGMVNVFNNLIVNCMFGANDPKFTSFPFATNPLLDFNYNEAWDLHLSAGSPALDASKVKAGFTPYFSASGLTLNGKTYKTPAPANYFGAFGQK